MYERYINKESVNVQNVTKGKIVGIQKKIVLAVLNITITKIVQPSFDLFSGAQPINFRSENSIVQNYNRTKIHFGNYVCLHSDLHTQYPLAMI